ncbi:PKD domain-containing protein [Sphingobacterium sp. HJSM2_6]|uniref:PKD domain-containing protein n=1 Tax=Sphingobacterium sp. HJSM2_6 TaxID=3366264 RepID=UPI003BBB392C
MKFLNIFYCCLFFSLVLSGCGKEEKVPVLIEEAPKPAAGFEFELVDPNDPFTYKFTNKSSNYKDVRWNFADDSTSSEASPVHTFLYTGTFNVKLVVLNEDGYWAQREETIRINPSSLINVITAPAGAGKLKISYETNMNVGSTSWLDGYTNAAPVISNEDNTELTFDAGAFKEIKLNIKTPKGSIAYLNLLVAELGIIKDITNVDNTFTISHENGGGPDGGEGSKKLIDNNTRTKVFLGGVGNNLSWRFEYFVPQIVNGYRMTSGNDAPERDPKAWRIEGSQDGQTWTTVDQRSNEEWTDRYQSRTFIFDNNTAYKHYRFSMTELRSGTNFQMSEVRLFNIPK